MISKTENTKQREVVCAFACGCMAVVFKAYLGNAVPGDYVKNLWDIAICEMASVLRENGINEADRVLTIARCMVLADLKNEDRENVCQWLDHWENLV